MEWGNVVTNNRYEILTPSGFKDFDGLYQSENKKILKIETNEEVIELTEDHEIFYDIDSKKPSKKFKVGDEIVNKKSEKSKITKITKINKKQKVYDLLNVRDEHRFFCNDLLVSNCLFLDEFSFVQSSIAEEFMASVYPTISSGKTSKIIIVSTPNGLNHFYNIWSDAIRGKNQYFPIKINWFDRPDRDETFKENVIKDIGIQKWMAEYQCIQKSSLVTVKDAESGIVKKVTVEDLYKYGKLLFV